MAILCLKHSTVGDVTFRYCIFWLWIYRAHDYEKNLHMNINDLNLSTTAFFVTVICKLNQMCIYNKRANLLDSAHLGKKI